MGPELSYCMTHARSFSTHFLRSWIRDDIVKDSKKYNLIYT